jgi:hypothetical protein
MIAPRARRALDPRSLLIVALVAGASVGLVTGSSVAKSVFCGGGYCSGTEQDDIMEGTEGYDQMVAGSGRDFVSTRGTGDDGNGGPDGDHVEGDNGNDTIHCEAGNENPSVAVQAGFEYWVGGFCWGGPHGDDVFGGLGEDEVASGFGTDRIWGKEDNDAMKADDGYADVVGGDSGYDTCDIGAGDSAFNCEKVY